MSIQALRPGQILRSRSGAKVAFVRLEAKTVVVGDSTGTGKKRLLRVPVNGGEEQVVVRNLQPFKDNAGKWQQGQELNGRYSQQDIAAGVLTPTDEFAPMVQEVDVTKHEEEEVAVSQIAGEQDHGPNAEQSATPQSIADVVTAQEPALAKVLACRVTLEEFAEVTAARKAAGIKLQPLMRWLLVEWARQQATPAQPGSSAGPAA